MEPLEICPGCFPAARHMNTVTLFLNNQFRGVLFVVSIFGETGIGLKAVAAGVIYFFAPTNTPPPVGSPHTYPI